MPSKECVDKNTEGVSRILYYLSEGSKEVEEICGGCEEIHIITVSFYEEVFAELESGEVKYFEELILRKSEYPACPDCRGNPFFNFTKLIGEVREELDRERKEESKKIKQ